MYSVVGSYVSVALQRRRRRRRKRRICMMSKNDNKEGII
jgi:hypothetical protein